jgi:hypothetical protein
MFYCRNVNWGSKLSHNLRTLENDHLHIYSLSLTLARDCPTCHSQRSIWLKARGIYLVTVWPAVCFQLHPGVNWNDGTADGAQNSRRNGERGWLTIFLSLFRGRSSTLGTNRMFARIDISMIHEELRDAKLWIHVDLMFFCGVCPSESRNANIWNMRSEDCTCVSIGKKASFQLFRECCQTRFFSLFDGRARDAVDVHEKKCFVIFGQVSRS